MEIRNDRMYAQSHEWVKFESGGTALVGVSDFAQNELGDLVFVNLPQEGDSVEKGGMLADVESVKAVSDIYSPVGGTVAAVNEELLDEPEKVNAAPYEAWLCCLTDISPDREGLMTADEYQAFLDKQ